MLLQYPQFFPNANTIFHFLNARARHADRFSELKLALQNYYANSTDDIIFETMCKALAKVKRLDITALLLMFNEFPDFFPRYNSRGESICHYLAPHLYNGMLLGYVRKDFNTPCNNGVFPLFNVLGYLPNTGCLERLQGYINNESYVAIDSLGRTALMFAAKQRNYKGAQVILKKWKELRRSDIWFY